MTGKPLADALMEDDNDRTCERLINLYDERKDECVLCQYVNQQNSIIDSLQRAITALQKAQLTFKRIGDLNAKSCK